MSYLFAIIKRKVICILISGMDNHTTEQRKKNMQAIKSKDSKIELILRKALWAKGYRYRKNYKKLEGKPDIVFIGKKLVIFCDSEFWHGKDYHTCVDRISTNESYWKKKIKRNIERDIEVNNILQEQGWRVIRFWETQIIKETDSCIKLIEQAINKEVIK